MTHRLALMAGLDLFNGFGSLEPITRRLSMRSLEGWELTAVLFRYVNGQHVHGTVEHAGCDLGSTDVDPDCVLFHRFQLHFYGSWPAS
jgi:hypothetical protein